MGTTTLLSLAQKVSEAIGDWLTVETTTNITTDKLIKSTSLNNYDRASDDYFSDWWVYLPDGNNAGTERLVSDYATATGQLTVYGANLNAETGAVTVNVSRRPYSEIKKAIINSVSRLYPNLHRKVDNLDLITGNVCPPFRWASSSTLDFYTEPSGTLAKTTTGGLFRSPGITSAKVTASGANDALVLDSDDYPRLLDLMGKTADFKVWVYPEVTDDTTIIVSTVSNDGTTTQTFTSTTSCPAGYWTLIELEDKEINDDLQKIEIKLNIATDTKYAYWMPPRAIGRNIREYALPSDFDNGHISQVYIQTSGYSDDACDDLHPRYWERVYGYDIGDFQIPAGNYKHIRLPAFYPENRRIRIVGDQPLEVLSADTDTISISNDKEIDLIIACAAHWLYREARGTPASEDVGRLAFEAERWPAEYRRLLSAARMTRTPGTLKIREY